MKADKKLSDNLQAVLVDLIELAIQGKQAHWNVVGKNFRDMHLQLDEIIAAARTASDEVAERMRALEALPDGRSEVVTKTTTTAGNLDHPDHAVVNISKDQLALLPVFKYLSDTNTPPTAPSQSR